MSLKYSYKDGKLRKISRHYIDFEDKTAKLSFFDAIKRLPRYMKIPIRLGVCERQFIREVKSEVEKMRNCEIEKEVR